MFTAPVPSWSHRAGCDIKINSYIVHTARLPFMCLPGTWASIIAQATYCSHAKACVTILFVFICKKKKKNDCWPQLPAGIWIHMGSMQSWFLGLDCCFKFYPATCAFVNFQSVNWKSLNIDKKFNLGSADLEFQLEPAIIEVSAGWQNPKQNSHLTRQLDLFQATTKR